MIENQPLIESLVQPLLEEGCSNPTPLEGVELRARTAAAGEKSDVNFDKQNRNDQVDREQESGEPR